MYALIDRLNREDGITIIMISHDISAAERYATHILLTGNAPIFSARRQPIRPNSHRKAVMHSDGCFSRNFLLTGRIRSCAMR